MVCFEETALQQHSTSLSLSLSLSIIVIVIVVVIDYRCHYRYRHCYLVYHRICYYFVNLVNCCLSSGTADGFW